MKDAKKQENLRKQVILEETEKTLKLIIGAELHISHYRKLQETAEEKKKADLEMKILQLEDSLKFNKSFVEHIAHELA